MGTVRTVLGTCHHDCPDSCGWVVTVEDGRATQLRGNPDHPYSRGELCPKVNRFLDRVYSPDRVLRPLRRVGAKGRRRFEQITWDDALAEIAARLHDVIGTHGAEAVLPYSSAGNQSLLSAASLDRRFFAHMGASQLDRSICGPTVGHGIAVTNGSKTGFDPLDLRHSRLIILWGTNTRITNRHLWPVIEEARHDGAQVVVIDPVRTATAEAVDWFVQPLPGTDAALMLAMMHVLVRDDLVDHDYVSRFAHGYDELVAHVAAWTPARAASACGITADEIERLAAAYGTIRPAGIRVLIGPEHHENGAMFFRTLACLPVLTGAWRDRGGGIARSTGAWIDQTIDEHALMRPELAGRFTRVVNMSRLGEALTNTELRPAIHALVVWNSNPLVVAPNAELIRRGLERDDLFTVVHEQFLTDTAAYADIVLPATTQIEQLDVVPPWGHLYLGWNEPAIDPLGEAVSNTELFRRLARVMGYTEPSLFDDDESLLRQGLPTVDLDELRRVGMQRVDLPTDLRPFADGRFPTASGKAELATDALRALGLDRLPTYVPPREHPQGDPDLAARYPLTLLTTKSHTRFLNTSYSHLPKHGPLEGQPTLEIDGADATERAIADGDTVRVWNDRAELEVVARISPRVRRGVVSLPFGWWQGQHRDGRTPNALTNDTLTDWGGGVAFHDTLVQVSRA